MPYIITTKRVRSAAPRDTSTGTALNADMVVSRHAVATLEEACNDAAMYAYDHTPESPARYLFTQLAIELPESGGTVGPLPDGTVIEVERWTWGELALEERTEGWADDLPANAEWPDAHRRIIDAYNGQQ